MKTNSYKAVKDYIFNKLCKVIGALPISKIEDEINKAKTVTSTVDPEMLATIFSLESTFHALNDEDWNRIQREMETHFDVKMQNGILIQGEEQQERDNAWWSTVEKQKKENYYWERYEKYLRLSLPPEVVKTIDTDTDIVMNNIENPSVETFSRYGMVVGHVQSGKTGNYSALICKAADAGYKFLVVIAGGINNLRNQTQQRLNESFVGQTKGIQVGSGKGNNDKKSLPLSLTTIESDFNRRDADRLSQGLNFDNISVPILLVIKKNTKTLASVIDWLEKQYKNKVSSHAMLVIDDESDYASINTNGEDDPTQINKKLRQLLGLFQKSAYVAYTATPYANIFIDHEAENKDIGKDLFPKDFIYALDAPTNYFGARKIFLDPNKTYLVEISDYTASLPTDHKKDLKISNLPDSLREAIRLFCVNVSIRNLRGDGNKHNSMLIHATRFTDIHKMLASYVEEYFKNLKFEIIAYGNLPNALELSQAIKEIKETFELRLTNIEFSWLEIIQSLVKLVDTIIVREVHQKTYIPLEYRNDVITNAIVVGGTSLARGYTLEGLSVSYFLRNTVFYDTLMQMGRWFGYRSGYEDLCRIYMPEEKIADFSEIIKATEELFNDFKLMAHAGKTPSDFGLAVQEHPDSALQITARNKQKNVTVFTYSMRLDGKSKETSYLSSSISDIDFNLEVVKKLVSQLRVVPENVSSNLLWRNTDKSVVQAFLKEFKTNGADPKGNSDPLGLRARMPIGFIQQYVLERNTNWDIALYTGSGQPFKVTEGISINKETRKLYLKNSLYEVQNRQVSSGNSESIALDKEKRKELGSDRARTRSQLQRPLLMLHILQPNNIDTLQEIAAFGVSFPGDVLSSADTIRLRINTVYYSNLLEELENDRDSDD